MVDLPAVPNSMRILAMIEWSNAIIVVPIVRPDSTSSSGSWQVPHPFFQFIYVLRVPQYLNFSSRLLVLVSSQVHY